MDPQSVIDTAMAAGATQLGSAEAAKIFREQCKSTIRVNVQLTNTERNLLKKMVSFPIMFTGGKVVTNDHPLLVACRDMARNIYENDFKISHSACRVLVVGAAAREIRMYSHNPHIFYYIYGKENKDYDRIIRPALNYICKMLKDKARKNNFNLFLPPSPCINTEEMRPALKRYFKMQEVLKDYVELKQMPANITTKPISCDTLIFEDSFYNYGPEDYVEIFEKTGAEIAYGYGLLPMELLFTDMPENPVYSITTFKRGGIKYACLTFRSGYCNGYVHEYDKWATLLKSPIITSKHSKISLAVELCAQIGPLQTFKIYRCRNRETIARSIELNERQRYVKVLDIMECVNKKTGRVIDPLVYFTMLETEYLDVLNYLLSLDTKSLTFQNTVAYIRRRMGGMSLITKELVEPWYLPKRKLRAAAMTIFLDVKLKTEQNEQVFSNINIGSVYEKFASLLKTMGRALIFPIALLYDWLIAGHLVDKLVLDCEDRMFQMDIIEPKKNVKHDDLNVGLYLDNPYEGDIPTCPICLDLMGKLGLQEVRCNHIEVDNIELGLTDEQLAQLKANLMDNDEDPAGLAAVKKRCSDNLPHSGFKRSVKVYYIKAGPGCGKSYLIRQLATTSDLVLAPFAKLRPDYVDLINTDGDNYDFFFKLHIGPWRREATDEYS